MYAELVSNSWTWPALHACCVNFARMVSAVTGRIACMQVQYGTAPGDYSHTATGRFTFYDQAYVNTSYTTGHLHHVKLEQLQANTTYYYRCVILLHAACSMRSQ